MSDPRVAALEGVAHTQPTEAVRVRGVDAVGRDAGRGRRRDGLVCAVLVALVAWAFGWLLRAEYVKPFWYDEVWRARLVVTDGGWWQALRAANAPSSPGWLGLERLLATAHRSELALRIGAPLALCLLAVASYLMLTRWVPRLLAAPAAALLALQPALGEYVTQLKPFPVEALACVVVVSALLHADDVAMLGRLRAHRRAHLLVGAAVLLATPVAFVAVPLLLLEAWRGLRGRTLRARLPGLSLAGAGVTFSALFYAMQSAQASGTYWTSAFVPVSWSAGPPAVVRGLASWVPGAFTSALPPAQGVAPTSALVRAGELRGLLTVGFCVLLVAAASAARRDRTLRALWTGLAGAVLLQLVASLLRLWPFGYVRASLFLLPLLVVLGVVGLSHLLRLALAARRSEAAVPLALVAAVGLAALLVSGSYAQAFLAQDGRALHRAYGSSTGEAVADARRLATPTTAVLVAGAMAHAGWDYYMNDDPATGRIGLTVPASRTLYVDVHGSPSVTRWLARTPSDQVLLFTPAGTSGAQLGQDSAVLAAAGLCATARTTYSVSGVLYVFRPCP